ncbi:MAG: FAD-dependent oxidoreductase, partial [Acidobacteria bacterium]|nr:FAD-dependent oxidoreductase [Acidobacteriota bacterium]
GLDAWKEASMGNWNRRSLLGALGALPLAAGMGSSSAPKLMGRRGRAVVVGAGAFGGWTALMLQRRGFQVTLVDTWGPGNSRASSGGDSRVIRGMYGPDEIYTDWVVRAFEIWLEEISRWKLELYHPTGALWMFRGDDGYARTSLPFLKSAGLPVEALTPSEAAKRWPQVVFEGVRSVYFEQKAGYLDARLACQTVAEGLVKEGGELVLAEARPGAREGSRLRSVELSGGRRLEADLFVFACGPWLGKAFPAEVGSKIRPTRQEVFYFGPPASPSPWQEGSFPVWIDFGERIFYGIPGNRYRGFKVADDTHGEEVDPTTLERRPSQEALNRARGLLAERFPGLDSAPLLEARVCQYENTPDGHYLLDRHPELENLWLAGGGSGHGFKLGPAVGEHMAALVAGDAEPLPRFSLARLRKLDSGSEASQLESGGPGTEGKT